MNLTLHRLNFWARQIKWSSFPIQTWWSSLPCVPQANQYILLWNSWYTVTHLPRSVRPLYSFGASCWLQLTWFWLCFLGDLKNFLLARRRMVNQPGAPEVTIILIIQGCMAEFLSRLTLHKYLFQSPKMSLRKSWQLWHWTLLAGSSIWQIWTLCTGEAKN